MVALKGEIQVDGKVKYAHLVAFIAFGLDFLY